MEKQQSVIYSKSYDLNLEIIKEISKAMASNPEYGLWLHKLTDSVNLLGTSAYLAQEIMSKGSLSLRLYTIRKHSYQCMYYLALLRDVKAVDKKFAESTLLKLTEILKLVGASISTMNKKRKKGIED